MFEKEAEEYARQSCYTEMQNPSLSESIDISDDIKEAVIFGYNKAKEDAILKIKDEGIVKPLKDSILRNERLSSQEQQELCSWIECAMDFGENLDECAEKLNYAKTIIQDLLSNSDEYARQRAMDWLEIC